MLFLSRCACNWHNWYKSAERISWWEKPRQCIGCGLAPCSAIINSFVWFRPIVVMEAARGHPSTLCKVEIIFGFQNLQMCPIKHKNQTTRWKWNFPISTGKGVYLPPYNSQKIIIIFVSSSFFFCAIDAVFQNFKEAKGSYLNNHFPKLIS